MIYLDYAATAEPVISVSNCAYHYWKNVNSHYSKTEKNAFKLCEESVKKAIGAKSGKVIFGGNASWFFEKLYNKYRNFWLCGLYEHDCVIKNGVETNFKMFQAYDGVYVHQLVNNITGEIFDVEKIGRHVRKNDGLFICDATAGIGKVKIPDNIDEWCDGFVTSSHKIGVDNKQIGCAWISDRFYHYFHLGDSVVNGYGWVDGTPDLACAKATTEAVMASCDEMEVYTANSSKLLWHLEQQLKINNIKHKYIDCENRTSAINAIVLSNINADTLCNYLADKGIYISPGHSACEENSNYRVLKQYCLTKEECESTIRISFGLHSQVKDIDDLVSGIVNFKEGYCND